MKKIISCICAFLLTVTNALAIDNDIYNLVLETLKEDTKAPVVASVGGDWNVIALSRGGAKTDEEYNDKYYKNVLQFISNNDSMKPTEYARIVLSLSSIGYDTKFLEEKLNDFDFVTKQGINGVVYALIALDSKDYRSGMRKYYLSYLLDRQNEDGGWSLAGEKSDIDVSAMVIQALSKYKYIDVVDTAINKCLVFIENSEINTSEGLSQCIIAFSTLGIDCDTYVNRLMDYYKDGRFLHKMGGDINRMATEQAALSLVAYKRFCNGDKAIYNMKLTD